MTASTPPVLLWFRSDLRLADNPALCAAVATGAPIIPVFILDEQTPGLRPYGGAARWWLHHSLAALAASLSRLGLNLLLRRGPAAQILAKLADETGAAALFWNRLYDPASRNRDEAIKSAHKSAGRRVESFNAALLAEPWEVKTGQGRFFQVFTPFWKAVKARGAPPAPLAPPQAPLPGVSGLAGDSLESWQLLPTSPDWAGGLRASWQPGEAGAHDRAKAFLDTTLTRYGLDRNRPDIAATSRLSPHLRFGEISPRQLWAATAFRAQGDIDTGGAEVFLREIGWREFAHHLLFHLPDMESTPLRSEFTGLPCRTAPDDLLAWQRGLTGYPIVDAGMRELWHTGWMHNRVRMIVGSLLVKHLLLPWKAGEDWFWDTLVDACPANNPASWQWVAGCGADAAPYFRIFNPVLQGEKFDPDGSYVRRWVPELKHLPEKFIHRPWEAPALILRECGVTLGRTYPHPLVALDEGRSRALAAFETIKKYNGEVA